MIAVVAGALLVFGGCARGLVWGEVEERAIGGVVGERGGNDRARGTLILVRHAERDDGAEDGLSSKGRERAAMLARVVAHAGVDAVLVSDQARTASTARGVVDLYKAAGRPVEVERFTSTIKNSEIAGTIRGLVVDDRVVLVVAHSNQIAGVLRELGGWKVPELGEGDFEFMFIVTLRGDRPPLLIRAGYPPSAE
jgi:phosphohistidine phosphatase SixA